MLVFTHVSSRKTSFAGWSPVCCKRHSARRSATSGRCCSAAFSTFFERQPQLLEGAAQRLSTERGAQLGFEFIEREIRLSAHDLPNAIRLGHPAWRSSSLGERSELALFTSLLLDTSHPRFADVESRRDLARTAAGITRRQDFFAKLC